VAVSGCSINGDDDAVREKGYMSKRLVICCDGTWNTPDQRTGASLTPTNVAKIALAFAPRDDKSGRVQQTFYRLGWSICSIAGGSFTTQN
jgi:uncharacterized protein (DUF2235 family)